MNQNIFSQLQADQDSWNSHQSRFNNDMLNFDMDKRSQQLTQQATNFATEQARKASGALSNQIFGQDITQSVVEAAPLLYKGGKYLKQRGLSGAVEDVADTATKSATDLAGRVKARVQELAPEVPKVEDPLAGVGGQLNPGMRGDATLARATAEQNVRGGLPDIESLRQGGTSATSQPASAAQRGITGMGGDRYRYDTASGTIRDAETGRQPDFSFQDEPRSTIFSRDTDVDSFRSDPVTRSRFDNILGVDEREQLQGQAIPEFKAPIQPPQAKQLSQLPSEARDPASIAQRVDYNPSVQSELPRAPAQRPPAQAGLGEEAKLGEEATEGAGLAEEAAEPEVAAVTEGVDLLADSRIPGVSTVAKGVEDVGSNVAKVVDDIPGVSSVEKGLKSVGDDLEEGFEDIFGGSKKATTGDFDKDFPAPPGGDATELQNRLDVLQRESGAPASGAPATDEELQDRASASARQVKQPTPPSAPKAQATKVATEDRAELPGAGETLMGATALAGLGVAAAEHDSQNLGSGSLAMPSAPTAPRAPGLAFEAAPTIDSTNYHNY